MEKLLMNLLTLGLKPLYKRNIACYKIIKEFRGKLSRHQNKTRKVDVEEIEKHPYRGDAI